MALIVTQKNRQAGGFVGSVMGAFGIDHRLDRAGIRAVVGAGIVDRETRQIEEERAEFAGIAVGIESGGPIARRAAQNGGIEPGEAAAVGPHPGQFAIVFRDQRDLDAGGGRRH